MNAEKEHIDELIAACLSNGWDKDAHGELKKWIAASAENEKYFMQQQEIWFSAIDAKEEAIYNKEKAFGKFRNRVAAATCERGGNAGRRCFRISAYWRYAAVAALLCVVSYFSYWQGEANVKEGFSDIVVEAPLGSRTKMSLPDGTLVWLNAGSRMAYSQGFGVENRKLELSGEGYFEVKRNEEVPFLVKTNSLQVAVLGTKFNFRDYPDDAEAIVSLSEGKVALNNLLKKEKEAFLSPNERVVLNKQSGNMKVETAAVSNALQWTNGYLFFDEELLPDVAKELERSYNVKIHIASDSLNTFRFYGNFVRREQSIQEVLEALSATRKIRYTMDGRNITLY